MEDDEKKVIELKRCFLASKLKMDSRDINSLIDYDLISSECAKQIKGTTTPRDKVGVLVDTLLTTHDPLAFPTFLRILNIRYPDVMDELRLELQFQQGNIVVHPAITAECRSVSSRPILTSRGLCEYDKRRYIRLLCMRTQFSKMLWQRRVERMEEDSEDLRSDGKEHDAFINALATNIHAFLQENREPLAEHGLSHVMMSTSDFLKHLDQSACQALDEQVDNVIKFAEKVCLQRDKLIEEKKEAISALGSRYNVHMVDLAVERIVHQWVKDMLECKQKIGELDRHIRELSNDIKTLEMIGPYQIKRRERTIEELEDQLEKKQFQESHLDQVVDELGARTAGIKKQNHQYKTHIDALLSDRRLQYIYARENRRLPGRKRMRPEIKAYMTNNRRNDPVIRQSVIVPKKIIYKTTPRVAKAKKVSPRVSTSISTSSPRKSQNLTRDSFDGNKNNTASQTTMGVNGRPRTARIRKSPRVSSSEPMIPYSKEPNRSTKRFLDQSFNVYSTERKMNKLKV